MAVCSGRAAIWMRREPPAFQGIKAHANAPAVTQAPRGLRAGGEGQGQPPRRWACRGRRPWCWEGSCGTRQGACGMTLVITCPSRAGRGGAQEGTGKEAPGAAPAGREVAQALDMDYLSHSHPGGAQHPAAEQPGGRRTETRALSAGSRGRVTGRRVPVRVQEEP